MNSESSEHFSLLVAAAAQTVHMSCQNLSMLWIFLTETYKIQLTFNSPRAALASSFSIPAAGHNAETATNQVRCEAYRRQKSTFSTIVSNSFYHDSQIVVGSLVRVHSLLSNTNYNGATGVVIQLLPNRYRVNLPTGVNINVPFGNIVLIAPTNSTEVRVL